MSGRTRGDVWKELGAPAEQVGSVNEPRTTRENGFDWNEKWVYLDGQGEPLQVVLWNRYDLVAVLRVSEDGAWLAEPAAEGAA